MTYDDVMMMSLMYANRMTRESYKPFSSTPLAVYINLSMLQEYLCQPDVARMAYMKV